jgi:hypothetical protein
MSDPKDALARFVRFIMRDTVYLGTYAATVQAQHADDTLDLLPDDERVRGNGLTNVPIRHGLPGVRVRVVVGSRLSLGFENGDPRRPFAALWEPGAIELISFNGGTQRIARQGDPVTCFWPPAAVITGTITGFGAFRGTITLGSPVPGIIEDGAERVLA